MPIIYMKRISNDSQGGRTMNMNMNITAGYTADLYANYAKSKSADKASQINKKNEAIVNRATDIAKANESKLSEKAQGFLASLREKYGDYDFYVGDINGDTDALTRGGSKEYSVIISSDEIERMANDEDYANQQMKYVEDAISMSKQVVEEVNKDSEDGEQTSISKLSIVIGKDGAMSIFAELERSTKLQSERIEKARQDKKEDKAEEEKKQQEEARAERLKNSPYDKFSKGSVKRTTVEANSVDELLEKIKSIEWDKIPAGGVGERFDLSI